MNAGMVLKILVIHNPAARRGRIRRVLKFVSLLRKRGHHVDVVETTERGHAREAARLCRVPDVIVAAGGDGTVNEVVDGLLTDKRRSSFPSISFLPMGTANVLAFEMKLPRRLKSIVAMIEHGRTLDVRPGIANGRHFVLMVSAGLDARAVAGVNVRAKRVMGGAAYILSALKAVREKRPFMDLTVDEQTLIRDMATVIVTRAHRYGGPFVLLPSAGLHTSGLHVVALQRFGFWAALRYGLALVTGQLHRQPDCHCFAAQSVSVRTNNENEPVQMDGDACTALPLSVSLSERTVPFLMAHS